MSTKTTRRIARIDKTTGAPCSPASPFASDEAADKSLSLGDLADDAGFLIRRAQVWIFQDFIRTLATCDIRPAQYAVLSTIDLNPGLTQMALAHSLNIERAQLMHMLDALEDRTLIVRLLSERDRRSHALHLTNSGQSFLRKARKLVAVHQANVAEKLGGRLDQLVRALSVFKP